MQPITCDKGSGNHYGYGDLLKKGITFERYKKILCISRGFSLINKKAGNPTEFIRLRELFDKRYTCVQISNSEYLQFSFKSGHSIEVIFKSLKWLFIEQDITYWNRSGGAMLYNGLCKIWD